MIDDAFHKRILVALHASAKPALHEAVAREVEAFFTAHPDEPRTTAAIGFVAGIVLDRLCSESEHTTSKKA